MGFCLYFHTGSKFGIVDENRLFQTFAVLTLCQISNLAENKGKKRTRNDSKTNQKRPENEPETIQKRTRNDPKTNQKRPENEPETTRKRTRNYPKTNQKRPENEHITIVFGSFLFIYIFKNKNKEIYK